MKISKIKIKLNRTKVSGKNIILPLSSSSALEVEDDLDFYESQKIEQNINPINSGEVIRYKPKNNKTITLNINNDRNYVLSNLFTQDQLRLKSPQVRNSFFILDVFDINNSSYNRKLFTQFYPLNPKTLYDSNDKCIREVVGVDSNIKIEIDQNDINTYFLIDEESVNSLPQIIYCKVRFFYATNGKIFNFAKVQNFSNEDDIFLSVRLNEDKTYEFLDTNIILYENNNPNLSDSNPDNNFQVSFDENIDKEIITENGEYL